MTGWRERLKVLRERILGGMRTSATREAPMTPVKDRKDDSIAAGTEGARAPGSPHPQAAPLPLAARSPVRPAVAQSPARLAPATARTKTKAPKTARLTPTSGASRSPAKVEKPAPPRALRPVAINLGIDFGTSFTKVCYRDVGTEESGVVSAGAAEALVPSVVVISQTGRLYLGDAARSVRSPVHIPYLKMRLAGVPIGDLLPEVKGVDPNAPESVKALSSWFLASVIARSQSWIAGNQADRLKGRSAVWSANVGVPVEHYDSVVLKTFQEVLGVAWLWVRGGAIPATLREALAAYDSTLPRLDAEVSDFHAVPEIAAAVQSFVMSREALEGIYVYFDIGGGTVDGVAFNYINRKGERRINFYSGKVASLGLAAIAAAIGGADGPIDATSFERLMTSCSPEKGSDATLKVRRLVAEVIMTAKFKDGRDWQVDAIQNRDYERKFIGQLAPSRMKPLIVFLGGGGSRSSWYTESISSTYKAFQHDRAGIPPYKLLQVPIPKDFSMEGAVSSDFNRFAIGYGLSFPFGEGPEIGLPSEFSIAEKPEPRKLRGVVDYADSKDAFD